MMYDFQTKAKLAKPCPFCGSKHIATDDLEWHKTHNFRAFTIECIDCGARLTGEGHENYNVAYRKALKKWNRRCEA